MDGVHLGRVISADIQIEDHGFLTPMVTIRYDDGGEQSFCPILAGPHASDVLKGVLKACCKYRWTDLPGSYVKCTVREGYIQGMSPAVTGFGEPFDLAEWKTAVEISDGAR